MKLRAIQCATGDHLLDHTGHNKYRLQANEHVELTLETQYSAVRVDTDGREVGSYYVPLAKIIRFWPLESVPPQKAAAPTKKAANQ
jgi:hypothetical protein